MEIIRPMTAMGIMSGPSLDGVEASLIITDGIDVFEKGSSISRKYPEEVKTLIRSVYGRHIGEDEDGLLSKAEEVVTNFHIKIAQELIEYSTLEAEDIDVIGMHGQTILHKPNEGITVQLGDGKKVANALGIDVISRLRNVDIAGGGQGAPLMPVFHEAITKQAEKPLAFLNIGGIAYVTWIGGSGELVSYDTGPGNMLIDDWAKKHTGVAMDENGDMAVRGTVNEKTLEKMLKLDYFQAPPPKSAGRSMFSELIEQVEGMSADDGAATLTALTVESIKRGAIKHMPEMPVKWIVSGGGTKNPTMMRMLRNTLETEVTSTSKKGWDAEYMEAQAVAFLAVRSIFGLPITYPSTTGVRQPSSGGKRNFPDKE
jgi:anhydro-N-acetylmuramic acid kinase